MTEQRLRPKYMVARIDVDGKAFGPGMKATDPDDVDSPFVLMPRKDPAALVAMVAYMDMCEPQLANEIRVWLKKVASSDLKFGTQGARNFVAVRTRLLREADR